MKYLETILAFLTQLARIIFPRKQKPAAGDCPCPDPMPAPPEPSLPSDAGDRSDPDLYRGDTLALVHPSPGPLNLLGWGLILSAALSSLGKTYGILF